MRATRAVIHLANLRRNLLALREWTKSVPKLCLAVKADAYGHGSTKIAAVAAECGVDFLGVATVDEALELRAAGCALPVLLYGLPIPEELPLVVANGITPFVCDEEFAEMVDGEAQRAGARVVVHIKIDTGMGRIGCSPADAPALATRIRNSRALALGGVSTHFAASDDGDRTFTTHQIDRFNAVVRQIRALGINPGIVHAGNSGGITNYPEAWYDMVRPGILAYGYQPAPGAANGVAVRPVMELRSQVVFIKKVRAGTTLSYGRTWKANRDTWVGTIPIGYGDGYNRLLSNKGEVWIGSRRYPVVGRVCMDQIMVDLGPDRVVDRYDTAVLFGPQQGAPDAEELAVKCGTIPYEVVCAITRRVPRVYVDDEAR